MRVYMRNCRWQPSHLLHECVIVNLAAQVGQTEPAGNDQVQLEAEVGLQNSSSPGFCQGCLFTNFYRRRPWNVDQIK